MRKKTMTQLKRITAGLLTYTMFVGCGPSSSTTSFGLLADSNSFQQSTSSFSGKIDILWVVDNSGSMGPFQSKLATNFSAFMTNFVGKGYDFHMAVTTSDAYRALPAFQNNSALSKFKDGMGQAHTTGYPVIDSSTPNIVSVFTTNASQGETGSGDERAFQSMEAALNNSLNSSFRRADAFLAVIILSDEDDFSSTVRLEGVSPDHSYTYTNLKPVSYYEDFLSTFTGSSGALKRFSVSAVTVKDTACLTAHKALAPSSVMGTRYIDLANRTGGVLSDICASNFVDGLDQIQQGIIELGSQFYLNRVPQVSTIKVFVDGVAISESTSNGYTYNAAANSIVFHGGSVPRAGANIVINFDPVSLL